MAFKSAPFAVCYASVYVTVDVSACDSVWHYNNCFYTRISSRVFDALAHSGYFVVWSVLCELARVYALGMRR